MNKTFNIISAIAMLAIATPAFAADSVSATTQTKMESDSDGNYVKKTSSEAVDTAGTKTTEDTKVKVNTSSDGATQKTVETSATTDPKGLMNKTTEKTVDTMKTDKNGDQKYTHKKKVDGTTTESTTIENK